MLAEWESITESERSKKHTLLLACQCWRQVLQSILRGSSKFTMVISAYRRCFSRSSVTAGRLADAVKKLVTKTQPEITQAEVNQVFSKSVYPLQNVEERMKKVAQEILMEDCDLKDVSLKDTYDKFKVLKGCHQEFGFLPQSYVTNDSKSLQDLCDYYTSLKPKPKTPFHKLEKQTLPPNLTVPGHPSCP